MIREFIYTGTVAAGLLAATWYGFFWAVGVM